MPVATTERPSTAPPTETEVFPRPTHPQADFPLAFFGDIRDTYPEKYGTLHEFRTPYGLWLIHILPHPPLMIARRANSQIFNEFPSFERPKNDFFAKLHDRVADTWAERWPGLADLFEPATSPNGVKPMAKTEVVLPGEGGHHGRKKIDILAVGNKGYPYAFEVRAKGVSRKEGQIVDHADIVEATTGIRPVPGIITFNFALTPARLTVRLITD